MKKIALLAVLALLFIGCRKESQEHKKIVGEWKLTASTKSESKEVPNATFIFEKIKKGVRSGVYYYEDDSTSGRFEFNYIIIEDELTYSFPYGENFAEGNFTIKELGKDRLTLYNDFDGTFYYERVN